MSAVLYFRYKSTRYKDVVVASKKFLDGWDIFRVGKKQHLFSSQKYSFDITPNRINMILNNIDDVEAVNEIREYLSYCMNDNEVYFHAFEEEVTNKLQGSFTSIPNVKVIAF